MVGLVHEQVQQQVVGALALDAAGAVDARLGRKAASVSPETKARRRSSTALCAAISGPMASNGSAGSQALGPSVPPSSAST